MDKFYQFFNIKEKVFKKEQIEDYLLKIYRDVHYSLMVGITLPDQDIPTTYNIYIGEDWGLHKFEAMSTISIQDALCQVLIDNEELHAIVKDVYEL